MIKNYLEKFTELNIKLLGTHLINNRLIRLSNDFISECKQKGDLHVKDLTTREESSTYFGEWKSCAPKNILSYLEQGENERV